MSVVVFFVNDCYFDDEHSEKYRHSGRLWRTVKYENVRFSEYTDAPKLIKGMDDYFPKYNKRRHSSLEKKLPHNVYHDGLIGISNQSQR